MASIEIIAAIKQTSARWRESSCTRIARVEAVGIIWRVCPKIGPMRNCPVALLKADIAPCKYCFIAPCWHHRVKQAWMNSQVRSRH
jgi:hypothetical protein